MFIALDCIANYTIDGSGYALYLEIPKNESRFMDIIIRNVGSKSESQDIGILFEERLIEGRVEFIPIVEKIGDLGDYFGHREIDAQNHEVLTHDFKPIPTAYENDFVLINTKKFSLKLENS
jgi:hypothetical protein